jgi:hypothetical protein
MRRVDEPVEPLAPGRPPRAFRWRGRRYVVQTVLTHWVETGAWWEAPPGPSAEPTAGTGDADSAAGEIPDHERQLWRVEISHRPGAGNRLGTGVLDLCCDPSHDPRQGATDWLVRHVHD